MTLRSWNPHDAGLLLWAGKERCGFVILNENNTVGFLETDNISREPDKFFEMDGDVVLTVFSSYNVLGFWHSHPPGSPQPSKTDKEWNPPHLDMFIICDLKIHRYQKKLSYDYQEVPVPWTASSAIDPLHRSPRSS